MTSLLHFWDYIKKYPHLNNLTTVCQLFFPEKIAFHEKKVSSWPVIFSLLKNFIRYISHFFKQSIKKTFTHRLKFNNINNFYYFIQGIIKGSFVLFSVGWLVFTVNTWQWRIQALWHHAFIYANCTSTIYLVPSLQMLIIHIIMLVNHYLALPH